LPPSTFVETPKSTSAAAISRGWELVRDNPGVLIGATVLGWVITLGVAFVPVLGWIVGIVLVGGLDYLFIRRIRGEAVQVATFSPASTSPSCT